MKPILLVLVLLASVTVHATEIIQLLSRNMPTHCGYVFEVNSELIIQIKNPATKMTGLLVSYQDEYTKQWSANTQLVLMSDSTHADLLTVKTQLRSMSTNPKYLLRKIKFAVIRESAAPVSTWYYSEFGREFGEKCFNSPSDTPFRERKILEGSR